MNKARIHLNKTWAQRQLQLALPLLPAGSGLALCFAGAPWTTAGEPGIDGVADAALRRLPLNLEGQPGGELLLRLPPDCSADSAQACAELLVHSLQGVMQAEHARRSVARETLESYREMAVLQRAVSELNASLKPAEVAACLLQEFADRPHADGFGAVYLRHGDVLSSSPIESHGEYASAAFASLARSPLFAVMSDEAHGDIVNNLAQSPLCPDATLPFQSLMWLPLLAHGKHLGLLVLASRRAEGYSAADLKRAQMLATIAASALHNARLYAGEQVMSQSLVSVISVGAALSNERDINRLLEAIMVAAKNISHADGGTLYLTAKDGKSLRFAILRNDTLGIALGGDPAHPITFPNLPLTTPDGQPNDAMIAAYVANRGETVNIADAYEAEGFDFSGTRKFDQSTGYRSKSFLTVPMRNHEKEIIGVLQLINAIDPETGRVLPFSAADQRLAESLASQAAIAVSNRQLISQLEELFVAFINMINLAIDEKSPYTAGHCVRVPVLTMMLAEAAVEAAQLPGNPLAGFVMDEQDRSELKIAGLLHDCGKVTTPVHVVDKATKLETIYDRIHTIETRFEVIKRDAENALLRAQLALRTPGDSAAEQELLSLCSAQLRQLDDDMAFLRRTNSGGEFMRDADLERIRAIAALYSWRDPCGAEQPCLSADELENLSIRAGTLTATERDIINHHIVATIRMLEQLPWSKNLKNVPEYAGGHHERMDGTGYPRGLKREEMSIQARMIGIADIFEALTARDRPYKKGKTLSESLTILGKMKQGGHVDPDLFDVFIRRKIYLEYAREYLEPEQIDAVDEHRLPGYVP